ncbi:MAG: hypothetical protein EOO59_12160, partial [Hymenobacter sp.]
MASTTSNWLSTTCCRAPSWVRRQQVVLSQLLVVLAIFGLHELGLSWPGVLSVLYLETLVAVLMLARRDGLLHRAAMAGALLAGSSLLLLAASHLAASPPALLYRDAALLALTGWLSIAFIQFTAKQLAIRFSSDATPASGLLSNLLNGFAGLAGLLQVGTGALLARALFHWPGVPVAGLLAALLGLAAVAFGLAYWVRATGLLPSWVRRQQLVLTQFFLVLGIFGLHELALSWPGVLVVLYLETMVAVLLLARRDSLLHRAAMLAALAAGASLLLLASTDWHTALPALLYRDALLVALAGWASIAFMQFTYQQFSSRANAEEAATLPHPALLARLLGCFAGLAGLLQAGAGTLLARALFHWHPVPVALLIVALVALAAGAFGLSRWVRASGLAPTWVRRHLKLLELPDEVQQRVSDGDLSLTIADLLRRQTDKGSITSRQAIDLAGKVAQGDMTPAEIRATFGESSGPKAPAQVRGAFRPGDGPEPRGDDNWHDAGSTADPASREYV